MATATTTVYPKPGVTLYLPGGVHGFDGKNGRGIPMDARHAAPLLAAGHLETAEQRKTRLASEAAAPATEAAAPLAQKTAAP